MIAICPNPFRDTGCRLSLKAEELLTQHGYECCICPVFDDSSESVIPAEIKTAKLTDVAADCSLIIVVGGDGTILSAARQLRECSVPILGVNLGSKGFMATLEPNELDYVLNAARGEYRLSRRMKIDVSLVRGGETIYTDCALNDAVIHGYGDCIKLTALCDGADITI